MAENEVSPAPRGGRAAKPPRYEYSFSSEIPLGTHDGTAVFYGRREINPRRNKLVKLHDLKEILLMGFYLCVAAAVPARHWNPICRFVSHLRVRKHRRKLFATLKRDLEAIAPAADPEAFFSEYRTMLHRRRLYYMAQVAAWHWKPRITVEGAEEIRRAVAGGGGVLIWCKNTAAQTLMGKRALHESGIGAYQVNAKEHGSSTTAFGLTAINPILLRIENRFLKGRLPFGSSDTVQVTKGILEALQTNAVVLISANTYHGRRFVQVPIGGEGYAHLATTPANFAVRGKTTLLAMSTVETVPFTEFRAVITPLASPENPESGGRDAAIAEVVSAFRDASESVVANFPAQCLGIGRDLVSYSIEERPGFRS
jgi:lauroyl/myristoyl acyltransferase